MWRKEDGQSFVIKEGKAKRKGIDIKNLSLLFQKYKCIFWILARHFDFHLFLVFMYRGENLQLHKVRRRDMGAFMCIASNNVPPTVSRRVSLNVNCKYNNYCLSILHIN